MFFELEIALCEKFPSLTPFSIRKESVYEVFLLVRRLNENTKNKQGNKKKKIRKRAGDNWF